MANDTVRKLAADLSAALVRDKRNDGQEFVHLKDGAADWIQPVVYAVHGEKLPDDTTYAFIERCADAIAEADDDCEPMEAINMIDADIDTHELTGWLHARADHTGYVDQAIQDLERACIGSITDLLQVGQALHIQEVGAALVSELERVAEEDASASN